MHLVTVSTAVEFSILVEVSNSEWYIYECSNRRDYANIRKCFPIHNNEQRKRENFSIFLFNRCSNYSKMGKNFTASSLPGRGIITCLCLYRWFFFLGKLIRVFIISCLLCYSLGALRICPWNLWIQFDGLTGCKDAEKVKSIANQPLSQENLLV